MNSPPDSLSQTEIKNLGVPALGDKNIGGLDIAVNDAFAVSGVERVRDFDSQWEKQFQVERAPANAVLQHVSGSQ